MGALEIILGAEHPQYKYSGCPGTHEHMVAPPMSANKERFDKEVPL